jgi:hypothetical protein
MPTLMKQKTTINAGVIAACSSVPSFDTIQKSTKPMTVRETVVTTMGNAIAATAL